MNSKSRRNRKGSKFLEVTSARWIDEFGVAFVPIRKANLCRSLIAVSVSSSCPGSFHKHESGLPVISSITIHLIHRSGRGMAGNLLWHRYTTGMFQQSQSFDSVHGSVKNASCHGTIRAFAGTTSSPVRVHTPVARSISRATVRRVRALNRRKLSASRRSCWSA
jgi:hypothetical protein